MPPCHTAGISDRVLPEIARLVEQHEAEPAADHDAERDPQQKVVGLGDRHRRLAAPQIRPRHEAARVEPAEQDAGHIGQAIPTDCDRSDLDRDGIDHGVGEDQEFHGGLAAAQMVGTPRPFTAGRAPVKRAERRPLASGGLRHWRAASHSLGMTQTTGRFFDELGKLITDAAGAADGVRKEIESVVRAQAERVLRDLDVVQREDFEAVKAMAQKAREENEALKERIAALEAAIVKGLADKG